MIDLSLPIESYHARSEIGSSRAKLVLNSIQLLKDDMDGLLEHKQSAAMQFGTMAHMAVLEPEKFRSLTTTTGPVNEKTGKEYGRDTKSWTEWEAANPTMTVVHPSLYRMLDRMPRDVRELLSGDGQSEVSIFTPINGVAAKVRPDRITESEILDLKTIGDLDDIDASIKRWKYWFSAAYYRAGVSSELGQAIPFRLIFAESAPPHRWAVVSLTPEYIDNGDYYVRYVTDQIKRAQDTGDWSDKSSIYRIATKPESLGAFDHDNQ